MHLEIPNRFAGPPEMGHGGYVAGLLAGRTDGAVQVTLRQPIPLDVDLELVSLDGGHLELRRGGEVLVESQPAALLASARATWFPMPAASSPSPGQPSCVSPPTPGGAGGAGGPTG